MNSRQLTARFIEQTRETLIPALAADTNLAVEEPLTHLIGLWLETHCALLLDTSCSLKEKTAQLIEYSTSLNLSLSDTLACIERLRKSLIESCRGKIGTVSDSDMIAFFSDNAAILTQNLVDAVSGAIPGKTASPVHCQKTILEAIQTPMAIINSDSVIEVANQAFCRTVNGAADTLEGRRIGDICDDTSAKKIHQTVAKKQVPQHCFSLAGDLNPGAASVPAKITCYPLSTPDGLPSGAAIALEAKEDGAPDVDTNLRYIQENLLPLLPLATQIIDRDGNITFSSSHVDALALNGYEGQEPLCCFLYHQRFGRQQECPCKTIFESLRFHMDEIYFDSHTDMKWFRLIIVPVPDRNGCISHACCCVHDMTHRRQIQKQMESQILSQQRSSLVAQLSVTVAHQLRNPLSVVLGFAEMMSKGLPPDQYAEAVSRILRNSMRCKDIVESLLDFGKGMPQDRRMVDLDVLIRESVRPMLTPAQNRLVEWRFSGKPTPVECVPEQMAQALLSLLHNAIRVANSRVLCSVENKGDLVRLRVVDDGPGIPIDLRERIFEPFFTTNREGGATGLGLSLARAVITDFGGSLTVGAPMGNEPRGACIVLQLPLQKKNKPESTKSKDAPKPTIQERYVLIVDDEVDMQDLLRTSLYLNGFLADTVATGMEALEKLEQNTYDAVVLDYQIEGALTCAQLYQEIQEQHAPLVRHLMFLTGDMMNYQARDFIQDTGRPVLEKPFLMADLITALKKLVPKTQR